MLSVRARAFERPVGENQLVPHLVFNRSAKSCVGMSALLLSLARVPSLNYLLPYKMATSWFKGFNTVGKDVKF